MDDRLPGDDAAPRSAGLVPPKRAITGDLPQSVDFISSIVAGLLLGLLLDWLFAASPVFVIAGAVAGFGSGFFKMWRASSFMDEAAEHARKYGTQSYRGDDAA